jgi:hypothetical protein
MPPALLLNVEYIIDDKRFESPRDCFFTENKCNLFICSFGVDSQFIGMDNKLWWIHSCPDTTLSKTNGLWFYTFKKKPAIMLFWQFPWFERVWSITEFRLICSICDGEASYEDEVCTVWLENVSHLLIKLQRWIRRKLWEDKKRLVLLMALHPRLGARSPLAELSPDIILNIFVYAQKDG